MRHGCVGERSAALVPHIQIARPAGKAAARDIEPNAMSSLEEIARGRELDAKERRLERNERHAIAPNVRIRSIAPAKDAVGHIVRSAIGLHVHQPSDEIGVHCARCGPQLDHHRARDLHVAREHI